MAPSAALQEVRLYAALCLCHILRINAPDTPYTDTELEVGGGMQGLLMCRRGAAPRPLGFWGPWPTLRCSVCSINGCRHAAVRRRASLSC